jgi:hypothetical protein
MPGQDPWLINLTKLGWKLAAPSRDYTSPYLGVVRAEIVLLAS